MQAWGAMNGSRQLYLLYPAVSQCISLPEKRDMAKNILQGRAEAEAEAEAVAAEVCKGSRRAIL